MCNVAYYNQYKNYMESTPSSPGFYEFTAYCCTEYNTPSHYTMYMMNDRIHI